MKASWVWRIAWLREFLWHVVALCAGVLIGMAFLWFVGWTLGVVP